MSDASVNDEIDYVEGTPGISVALERKINGGFHDVASFRAELGDDVSSMSDYEIQKIVNENRKEAERSGTNLNEFLSHDIKQQETKLKQQEREMESMRSEMNKLKLNKNDDWHNVRDLRDDLQYGKNYSKNLFYYTSPSILDDYLKKERIKREVKEELINEKQQKERERELAKLWSNYDKPKRSPRKAKKSPRKAKKSPRKAKKSPRKAKK
jgi:hypothetical protein